jgi:predicted house-cleaning noncanonical NTP pyrophosphatase (MazG superfamily)
MASSEPMMTAITSWSTPRDSVSPARLGGKAAGLFALPREWVPPFFVVRLGSTFDPALDQLLALCGRDSTSPGLIVRSNALSEDTTSVRGTYISVFVGADVYAVRAAIGEVLAQPTRPGDDMLAIVQLTMRCVAQGHLSNERHVTERRTQWVVEDETPMSSPSSFRRLTGHDKGNEVLEAGNRVQVRRALRHVAFRLGGHEHRLHCEWVWDGRRVWVVQRDSVPEVRGGPVHAYLAARARRPAAEQPPSTSLIHRLDAGQTVGWSKLSKPTIFEALGMPTAEVWHLSGEAFLAEEAHGFAQVIADLEALLTQGPIVVRCDVRAYRGYADLSLPTSDPVEQAADALQFMRRTAVDYFAHPVVRPEDWAFLPAVLVPARVSIMAQAKPGGQRVRLDALWGYPDGVGLLAHDKWSHDVFPDEVDERRAHKDSCFVYLKGRGWCFERVPAPHDWGHCINADEARIASSWARRLADHLDREVQLMVLARIDGDRGADAMLPWHYTDHEVPTGRAHVATVPSTGIISVSRPEELDVLDLSRHRGVLLRPQVGWHRDRGFLMAIGASASAADVPVYFEGSVLGHPYYLIKSAGAVVVPVGQNEPEGVHIEYNKLVRDGIPDIVRGTGGAVRAVRASPEEAQWLLRQKLVEEAFEVADATSEEMVEELADLAETVLALCRHAGIEPREVELARRDKHAARGGFDDVVYLQTTSSTPPDGDERLEMPSLFSSDAADSRAPASQHTPSIVRIEESSASRIVFKVPLVAPLREGIPLREYGLEVGQGKVMFRHRGPELEITIEETQPVQAPGQLSLPVDPI